MISHFNPTSQCDNKTISKNLEQQFMSLIKLKPKSCTTWKRFGKDLERKMKRQTEMNPSIEH